MSTLGGRIDREEGTPAHAQVRSRLLALIQEGAWKPGEKLPPEPDIAARLGVSRMTANKAILSLVSDGWLLREKGRGTFVARDAGAVERCAIAIAEDLTLSLEDHYFGSLYWALHTVCDGSGIPIDLVRLGAGISSRVSGGGLIAINPQEHYIGPLQELAASGPRVVILGASWRNCPLPQIDSDNILGATLAVNHLLDLGHRSILFVGACPDDANTIDRLRGFTVGLTARGGDPNEHPPILVPEALALGEAVERDLLEVLRGPDRPTAIFAAGAHLAMRVLALAYQAGLKIPNDLSLIGYDDPNFLSLAYPPVTTVRQPLAQMAACAFDAIMRSGAPSKAHPAPLLFEPELIIRGTTSAPFRT